MFLCIPLCFLLFLLRPPSIKLCRLQCPFNLASLQVLCYCKLKSQLLCSASNRFVIAKIIKVQWVYGKLLLNRLSPCVQRKISSNVLLNSNQWKKNLSSLRARSMKPYRCIQDLWPFHTVKNLGNKSNKDWLPSLLWFSISKSPFGVKILILPKL